MNSRNISGSGVLIGMSVEGDDLSDISPSDHLQILLKSFLSTRSGKLSGRDAFFVLTGRDDFRFGLIKYSVSILGRLQLIFLDLSFVDFLAVSVELEIKRA